MTNTLPVDKKNTTTLSSSTLLPTRGQLQRNISQEIQSLYYEHLGHRTDKITCNILGQSITILIENAITKLEQLLANQQQKELSKQLRTTLDKTLQPLLIALIQDIVEVEVVDLFSDTTLETKRTGIMVILSEPPKFRPAKFMKKAAKKNLR